MTSAGTFFIDIAVEHPARRGDLRPIKTVMVDSGSELTWVPAEILDQLGIPREHVERFILADGRVVERATGIAIVHAAGTFAPDWVVFAEAGDMVLLGSRSMQGMNLRVDPRSKRLVPGGPIVTAAA
jgi:predicted aspartyl protease